VDGDLSREAARGGQRVDAVARELIRRDILPDMVTDATPNSVTSAAVASSTASCTV